MTNQQTIDGRDPALEMWCDGYGTVPAEWMFVGISAGRLGAIKTQVPFTKGPSGRLLQRCLGRLGLSESDEFSIKPKLVDCYLTNFVKGICLDDKGLNRLPSKSEFLFWRPTLLNEIQTVKPRIIAALSQIVFGEIGLSVDGAKVVLLKHPRWYESHGALSNEVAFGQMVFDYRDALL